MLYLIPGLGADARIFQDLDVGNRETVTIQWEKILPTQSLQEYVRRLLPQIQKGDENIELLGVSFGGIVAMEMSKYVDCKRLISVSSIMSPQEWSLTARLARLSKFYLWLPASWIKQLSNWFGSYAFGPLSMNEKQLLHQIIQDTEPEFLVWALQQTFEWKGVDVNCPILRLHGNKDRIFPIRKVPTCAVIRDGGHLMIKTHASVISEWIKGDWVK